MKKIYFHIGLPKTATTFFQKHIFKENFFNLGKPYDVENKNEYNEIVDDLLDGIFTLDDFQFENKKKKYVELIESLLRFNLTNKPNIISLEDFTYPFNPFELNLLRIYRLITLFNLSNVELKIFFFIRKQDEIFSSSFLWSLSNLHEIDPKFIKFKNFTNSIITQKNELSSYIDCLNYYKLYKKILGKLKNENLKVFVFENFRENTKFLNDFHKYFGINIQLDKTKKFQNKKENYDSLQPLWVFYIFLNKNYGEFKYILKTFFKKKNPYDKLKSKMIKKINFTRKIKTLFLFLWTIIMSKINNDYKIQFTEEEIDKIKYIFSESNKKLDKELNLDLKKFNYYL